MDYDSELLHRDLSRLLEWGRIILTHHGFPDYTKCTFIARFPQSDWKEHVGYVISQEQYEDVIDALWFGIELHKKRFGI